MADRERDAREGAPIEDLGDGLLLRHASRDDADRLAAFNGEVHKRHDATEPSADITAWTRDLLTRPHPTFGPHDFMLVEDRRTGAIVSSLNQISQTWTYGGVPLKAGRPELVGTHPDYRNRGLIRRQMEVVHRWSRERGELVQGITGIPWYYRQFGYEYALALGGGRAVGLDAVPTLPNGAGEPYRVRPATPDDAPFLADVDAHARRRLLVACVRDASLWRYEIDGRSDVQGARAGVVAVIEDGDGRSVGCVAHSGQVGERALETAFYELTTGASWADATPPVLRYLAARGAEYAARPTPEPCRALHLDLGAEHPSYRWLPGSGGESRRPYAWYVRVADLPAFLRHVAPVLEARLADSGAAGLTGQILLTFYRSSLRLAFERGSLIAAEPDRVERHEADAAFPDLTFLQILFGHRSLAELRDAFPDCFVRDERAASLVDVLFPKQPSHVWAVS